MNEKVIEALSGKYKIALFTTYNFDLEYFDNNIFYKLFVNGIKDVSVFVDSNQLQESLKNKKTNLGIRYSVIPFKMTKSFHPKVILLLDETKAKLLVGSMNLTEKGYSHNQEIYNVFEYDKENQENLNIILEAFKFFERLNEYSEEHDNDLINKLSNIPYLNRNSTKKEIKLIHNLERPIYEQVMDYIEDNIKQIDIAVPFYDTILNYDYKKSALSKIQECHPKAEIKMYIQNEKSTFPQKLYELFKNNIFVFKRVICNECGNFYHGKVFRFVTEDASYILYGSANCTNVALMCSYNEGGNVECDILEKGTIHEYDDLFLQFEEDNSEFTSYPEREDLEKKEINFILDYLEHNDKVKVFINYKKRIKDIKVTINHKQDYSCSWEYVDDKLVIDIPKETLKEIGNIFTVVIESPEENIINCFFNDYEAISNYRNADNSDKNIAKKILSKNDIFINDVLDLMYQMPNNAADIKRIKDNNKLYQEQKIETEESETDEEYIINEEILLEYQKRYEEDKTIKNAFLKVGNSYYLTLRDIIRFEDNQKSLKKTNIPVIKEVVTPIVNTDVSDEELEIFNRRKGKRIIKKIVNGILTDNYLEEIDYYNYKAYIGSIYLFFDKYTDYRTDNEIQLSDDQKKDYLFEYKNVSSSKYELANALLNLLLKENKENIEEEKEDILILCIQAILQQSYSIEEYAIEDKKFIISAPKMIKQLDELYYIRDTFVEYVRKTLKIINYHKQIMNDEYAISKIEKLFDYKSINKIKEIIKYKEDYELIENNNSIILKVKTNETISFVNVKLELLRNELNKYFKNKHNLKDEIDSFAIIVENPSVNLSNYDPVISIQMLWNEVGYTKVKNTKLKNNILEEKIHF